MPPKKQIALAQLKVGIFVTIALVLLGALILQQSWGLNWFSRSAKALTYLPDVGGLKSGAPVWLAGIEIRALPSGSTNSAAPTSFSCRMRLGFLTRGSALTWSRTFSHTACG